MIFGTLCRLIRGRVRVGDHTLRAECVGDLLIPEVWYQVDNRLEIRIEAVPINGPRIRSQVFNGSNKGFFRFEFAEMIERCGQTRLRVLKQRKSARKVRGYAETANRIQNIDVVGILSRGEGDQIADDRIVTRVNQRNDCRVSERTCIRVFRCKLQRNRHNICLFMKSEQDKRMGVALILDIDQSSRADRPTQRAKCQFDCGPPTITEGEGS